MLSLLPIFLILLLQHECPCFPKVQCSETLFHQELGDKAILVITCCNFQAKCTTSHLCECVFGNVFCVHQGLDSHSGTVTSCICQMGRLHGGSFAMQVQLLHSFSAPLFKLAIPWKKKPMVPFLNFFCAENKNLQWCPHFRKTQEWCVTDKENNHTPGEEWILLPAEK